MSLPHKKPAEKQACKDWADAQTSPDDILQAYQGLRTDEVIRNQDLPDRAEPEKLCRWLLRYTPYDDRRLGQAVAQHPPRHWVEHSQHPDNPNIYFQDGLSRGLGERLQDNLTTDGQ